MGANRISMEDTMSLTEAYLEYRAHNYENAIRLCHTVLFDDRHNHEAFNLMGACCMMRETFKDACGLFRNALKYDPTNPRYLSNMSAALQECHETQSAVLYAKSALDGAPNDASCLLNAGVACRRAGEHKETQQFARRAIVAEPNNADAHVMLGENLLLLGEWEAGWRERTMWSPKRMKMPFDTHPEIQSIEWNGMHLPGEKIVVLCDEGFGDAIQYARFLRFVARRSAGVILVGPMELELLRDVDGVIDYQTWDDEIPEHGAHCRISLLPIFFPYVPRDAYIPAALPPLPQYMPRIGLAWRGRPIPRGRSIPFDLMASVLREMDAEFVSLQPDITTQERELLPTMQCPEIKTFRDTRDVINTTDWVLSIDSAVVHLAGAMGKPTMVLLSRDNDWRWGTHLSGWSPFYHSVCMLRQEVAGDWKSVLERVRDGSY